MPGRHLGNSAPHNSFHNSKLLILKQSHKDVKTAWTQTNLALTTMSSD